MKRILKIIVLYFLFMTINCNADDKILYQNEFENSTIYIDVNSYKILQFKKRIKNLEITNSEKIVAEILNNEEKPLTTIKIYAKKPGNESSIVTFQDNSIISVGFNIVPHLKNLITMMESTYPNLKVEQINDTIFLKGEVSNQKDKDKILEMFRKFNIDPEKKVVDMISTSNPKMIRIKLYAVEINNDKGMDIKNNWIASSKNYSRYTIYKSELLPTSIDKDGNTLYSRVEREYDHNLPIGKAEDANVNDQYSENVESALDDIMTNAVSLTGGLTGAANFLGKYFNAGLTINYLSDEGVANVLDETTLITLEDKEAKFLAGGEVYVRLEAQDAVELRQLNYGLELTLTAKEVMNDEFVHLNVTTKSRALDWANQVDNIPAITNKSINTTVIIKDKSTVVLGGLINSKNAKDIEKIPLLGDLPILGFLFKSSSFKEGKSELVFFITPEIVKAVNNNQSSDLEKNKNKMFKRSKTNTNRYLDMFNLNYETDSENENDNNVKSKKETNKKEDSASFLNIFKSNTPKLTDEEKHKQRVNKILYGIN